MTFEPTHYMCNKCFHCSPSCVAFTQCVRNSVLPKGMGLVTMFIKNERSVERKGVNAIR